LLQIVVVVVDGRVSLFNWFRSGARKKIKVFIILVGSRLHSVN
jgi:hypothetical protein